MQVNIYFSVNGELVGSADICPHQYAEECQSPEGHVAARGILNDDTCARLGLDGGETIFALTT